MNLVIYETDTRKIQRFIEDAIVLPKRIIGKKINVLRKANPAPNIAYAWTDDVITPIVEVITHQHTRQGKTFEDFRGFNETIGISSVIPTNGR